MRIHSSGPIQRPPRIELSDSPCFPPPCEGSQPATTPPASLRGLASNSKNIGDDSIDWNSQEDDDSDNSAHLGSSRPERLRHNNTESHDEEQQTRMDKTGKHFRLIRIILRDTPPLPCPPTGSQ